MPFFTISYIRFPFPLETKKKENQSCLTHLILYMPIDECIEL